MPTTTCSNHETNYGTSTHTSRNDQLAARKRIAARDRRAGESGSRNYGSAEASGWELSDPVQERKRLSAPGMCHEPVREDGHHSASLRLGWSTRRHTQAGTCNH